MGVIANAPGAAVGSNDDVVDIVHEFCIVDQTCTNDSEHTPQPRETREEQHHSGG